MNKLNITIREEGNFWILATDAIERKFSTACEALTSAKRVGAKMAPSIVTITWCPMTALGTRIVRAVAEVSS